MKQKELTDRLDKASIEYYNGKTTGLSDAEFDALLKELQSMEKQSGVVYPNSPTQRVGSDIQSEFKKGYHPYPMLTIENTYNDAEVSEWAKKKAEEHKGISFHMSVKYDGVSLELHYKGGYLIKALTRGDKMVGDDVTENAKTIKSIPLHIDGFESEDEMFYVRGEVLMPKSMMEHINEDRRVLGEAPMANTRNACSGSLKQLDPKVTASRGLIFRAWDCSAPLSTMEAKMDYLERLGFFHEEGTVVPAIYYGDDFGKSVNGFKSIVDMLDLDYDYDGIVIKINETDVQSEIGTKDTRAIEWGIARKWNEEYIVDTDLLGVDWQVGRTGVVTPVGRIIPVNCGGVTISNVTLHNVDFIEGLGLKIWHTLKITRSGGVIPYVLGSAYDIVMELNGVYKPIEIPKVCPVCGKPLIMEGALLKCTNEDCSAKKKGKILQFCSKDGMDIKSIGEKVVDDLFERGVVKSLEDIIALGGHSEPQMEELMKMKTAEGYGEKSVQKIIDGLDEARERMPWVRVLGSLSIPNVGKVMARTLAARFTDVYAFKNATKENLVAIDGIAETTADGILEWIENNENLLNAIEYWGWHWQNQATEENTENESPKKLDGLTVVFSGSSNKFKGDEVEAYLENNGATCGHSVTKKTHYLIVGEKPGPSKVKKATELGIPIVAEDDFYAKFGITL